MYLIKFYFSQLNHRFNRFTVRLGNAAHLHFFKRIKFILLTCTALALVQMSAQIHASNTVTTPQTTHTRTIQHALGQTVIHGKPVRIVSLMQGATDTLVALDVKPVGVVESWSEKPMYQYLRPQLQGVKYVGLETQPSLEDIAQLKPDLIIASKFRNEKTYRILSEIAPTIMLSEVYEFKETLALVGKAVGKEQRADALLQQWNSRIEHTQQKLKRHYQQQWPQQISLLEVRDDHFRAYSPQSFSGQILTELGFKWSKISLNQQWALQKLSNKESIPLLNADIFFVFMRENPTTQQNFASWQAHPLWKRLKAAKQHQIYQVNSTYWNLTGGILGANRVLDEIDQVLALDLPNAASDLIAQPIMNVNALFHSKTSLQADPILQAHPIRLTQINPKLFSCASTNQIKNGNGLKHSHTVDTSCGAL